MAISYLRMLMVLFQKEMQLSWNLRLRLVGITLLAALILIVFSLNLAAEPQLLKQAASAMIWIAQVFASTLILSEDAQLEQRNGAYQGLLVLGILPGLFFVSKALSCTLQLSLVFGVLLLLAQILFDLPHLSLLFFTISGLGILAISGLGTVCANLVLHSRAPAMLLPIVFYPLLLPCLLALVTSTQAMLQMSIGNEIVWVTVLLLFNSIFWLLGLFLFHRLG